MKKRFLLSIFALTCLLFFSTNAKAATNFDELKDELNGNDSNVTLESSIVIDNEEKELDLNGKTLILNDTILVKDSGKLTVKGNGTVKSADARSGKFALFKVEKGGSLTLENGNYYNSAYHGSAVLVEGSSVDDNVKTYVNIAKDSTLNANYGLGIVYEPTSKKSFGVVADVYGKINGITGNEGWNYGSIGIQVSGVLKDITGNVPVVNVYESTIINTASGKSGDLNDDASAAIYAAGFAKWNIKGGNFTGSEALSVKSGILNVYGGIFKANGTFVDPAEAYTGGTEATGSAISITTNKSYAGNIEMNINDANVISENGYGFSEYITLGDEASVKSLNISNGVFNGKEGAIYSQNIDSFIAGGKYSLDVKEYLKTNYVSKVIDNMYVVGKENSITVNKVENGEVTVDKIKAIQGEIVSINLKLNNGYILKALKVTDISEKEIEVKDNKFVMPNSDVTITADIIKAEVQIILPVLDINLTAKELVAGIVSPEETEKVLLESLKANSELTSKIENINSKIEISINSIEVNDDVNNKILDVLRKKVKNLQISQYFDISINVKEKDTDQIIGNLSNLTDEIDISLLLPESLSNVKDGYKRTYYIVREHEGNIDVLDAKISEDGKYLTFKTDKFSTYALVYQDEKLDAAANPKTGDTVWLYVIIIGIAVIGVVFTSKRTLSKHKIK